MTTIRKALIAAAGGAATALLSGLGTALVDDGALTQAEVGISFGAALLAAAAVGRTVWAVPNSAPPS